MRDRFRVVDRNLLIGAGRRGACPTGRRKKEIDPAIRDFRLLQYDMMFGERDGNVGVLPGARGDLGLGTSGIDRRAA